MDKLNELKWTLSTTAELDALRAFLDGMETDKSKEVNPLANTEGQSAVSLLAGIGKVLRSKDSLSQIHIFHPATQATELIQSIRDYWTLLRDRGLADANPVKIYVSSDDDTSIIFIFRWKAAASRTAAMTDADVVAQWNLVRAQSITKQVIPLANEIYQGFEYRGFPKVGGVELLRGKCTCTVKLDAFPDAFELDGQNGFVIMHRGPRLKQGDSSLMPVNILAHGADSPATLAMAAKGLTQPIRVEQNTELPQFGVIRSLKSPLAGPDEPDFPATAMWVVHWKIHTPMGTVITDPNVPLVFGPTTVQHYPPVGTEFKSATGPVDIMLADTGEVVGKLIPGELTAFDIVVTMDDEIPSVMDKPAEYYIRMFNKVVADPTQKIDLDGFTNDFRVPPSVLANFED